MQGIRTTPRKSKGRTEDRSRIQTSIAAIQLGVGVIEGEKDFPREGAWEGNAKGEVRDTQIKVAEGKKKYASTSRGRV